MKATFALFAAVLAACAARASGESGKYEATCSTSRGEVRVSSFSKGSLRVTRGRPVSPELVFDADRRSELEFEKGQDEMRVKSGGLVAVVSHATGLVRFEDAAGRPILAERRVGEKDIAFDSPSGERLFGLGQFQDGQLDVRNLPRRLTQVNTQISAPFLVSTRGWGLYWHNYSKIEVNECADEVKLSKTGDGKETEVSITTAQGGASEKRRGVVLEGSFDAAKDCEYAFMLDCGREMSRVQYVEIDGTVFVDNENVWLPPTIGFRAALKAGAHRVRVVANANDRTRLTFRPDRGETTFRSDIADGTDYIVYLGSPETAVAHFRADCGGTAALPDWAWGYWHCQERFVTQDDLIRAMRYFKERGLPLSVIVQDWQWWRSGTWNSMEWDAKRFPDPKGMVDECHRNGVRVMLSVWSKTEVDSDFCRAVKDAQGFIPGTPWIDFSNKSAADVYWKWFAEKLVSTGVDAWWLDAVEPENDALHGRTLALGDGDRYRNVYPLLVNTEADRRMRALRPGETPLVLTRCAFPGQTRTACVMWSGDVGNSWKDLRTQIIAGLGFASAGFPYWTSDAGGFFRPGDQYTNGDYHKRLVRWLQFATFCPIQRVHGFVSDTTPSRYGERTEKLLNDQVRLREKLRPYILRVAQDVAENNAMMMRPLYDAPRGFETEYMFGPDLLVCPVTADVEEMDVWLPEGGWRDFHTGEKMSGGRVVRAKTPIDRIPVYVREDASLASVGPAYELKYDSPAKVWEEALPLGSGFVGAMVWGGTSHETVDLNEDTVWSGSPNSNVNPDFRARLGDLRKAILDGDWKNADPGKIPGARNHGMNYQFPGSLKLDFDGVSGKVDGYLRTLSLDDAFARVTFAADGIRHDRAAFTPLGKGGFVYMLKADRKGALAFRASFKRAHESAEISVEDGTLVLRGVTSDKDGVPGKVHYTVLVKIADCDGAVSADGEALRVSGASRATVSVAIGTNFKRYDDISGDADAVAKARLAGLTRFDARTLFAFHCKAYRAQADRCTLDLGPDKFPQETTDRRLADFASSDDPYFAALYFRYGRYLLISCSQPGSQPANLQGIWNNSLTPPWCSKYTVNINTEMNYWPSEVTNLGDLSDPLFRMVRELSVTGAKAAEEMYGAKGWVTHHNTDIWRIAGPVDTYLACGWWPSGGGWLSTHLWEHYLYTRDRDFLAKAYPILRGAAEFYDTFAVENPETGRLAFIPSNSPENTAHGHPNGFDPVCMMDHQIARDVWRNAIEAAKVLGCDAEFAEKLGKRLEKLEPDRVGKWGQLQEWGADLDNPGDHHRHVSHLYALYPSAQITPETPELFNAARVSLEKRGDVSTGWAMGWRVCLWARLLDGDHAFRLIQNQLSPLGRNAGGGGTYPNLFDAHPPFQIDGNFGCAAGIAEMLMQSHRGFVELLPALPKAWPSGSVKGLRARGGWTVDIAWKDGVVTECTIRASVGGKLRLKINGKISEYDVKPGATVRP